MALLRGARPQLIRSRRVAGVVIMVALASASAVSTRQTSTTFVYVTLFDTPVSGVRAFDATSGALVPVAGIVADARDARGVAVSPDGTSVYVADNAGNAIVQYTAAADGTLSPKNPLSVASGAGPNRLVVSPDGGSVYAANGLDGTVSQYDVSSGGALVPKNPATIPAGAFPDGIAITPDGSSVYVTNRNDDTISQFDVGAGGILSPKRPATIASPSPVSIVVSPDGASVYAANVGSGTVSQYDVGAGGVLSPKFPAIVPAGAGPVDLVVNHRGTSLYVSNRDAAAISQYDIDPALGTLAAKAAPQVPADCFLLGGIAISPDDASVYVAGSACGIIFQYDVDSAAGSLEPKSSSWVSAEGSPAYFAVGSPAVTSAGIAFDPTSLAFSKQKVGTISPSQTVTVTNPGETTLTITAVQIVGPDADEFRVSGETCGGAIVAPGASCGISIRFAPIARGPATAAVRVASSAPGVNEVPLHGTTKPPR